jgi:hypothetical protein
VRPPIDAGSICCGVSMTRADSLQSGSYPQAVK